MRWRALFISLYSAESLRKADEKPRLSLDLLACDDIGGWELNSVGGCTLTPGSPKVHPGFTPGSPRVHPGSTPGFTPGSPRLFNAL